MKAQNKKAKKIIIGIMISCIVLASCFVAFNYEKITPIINSAFNINTTQATIQEQETKAQKATKKPKSKKKKKHKKKKATEPILYTYVLNTNTRRFHTEYCRYVDTIAEHNKEIIEDTRENIIERGFKPCQVCLP